MPKINRLPTRMDCMGVSLTTPLDRMAPGKYPFMLNARVVEEGRIESRPGYTQYDTVNSINLLHSIRRLNDPDEIYAAAGYTNIVGNGTTLWAGAQGSLAQIDTGYSGNPLSLITFRPDNSPESWMYVYDIDRQQKVRPDGALRNIGVAPPPVAPTITYGAPAMVTVNDGFSATNWVAYASSGGSPGIAATDRTNGSSATVTSIQYDSGSTGWCCINPNNSQPFWTGERMRVVLNSGGMNQETVLVREIHTAIASTTIAGIQYDSGSTGLCSVVLTGSPAGLDRNSLISIINAGSQTDILRVLAVILSPDGLTYSLRTSTVHTFSAGNTVTGLVSWYCYTTQTHASSETITLMYLAVGGATGSAPFVSSAALLTSLNLAAAAGRPIDPANDYMHISLQVTNPQFVTTILVQLDIDASTSTVGSSGNAFIRNYFQWTITQAQLNEYVGNVLGGAWTEILLPISEATRFGSDASRTLANVAAIQVVVNSSTSTTFGFDDWYLFGTYGPTILPNAPTGYQYLSADRDSTTGAGSVPGPATIYQLFPLREQVIITPQTSTDPGVDSLDIYREGGDLTSFTYDGTVANNTGSPVSYYDNQSDAIIESNPSPDTTLVEPWPILQPPWSGTVNVVGTTVTWVSGQQFSTKLLAATVININGTDYQIQGNPTSATELQIILSAGVETGVSYLIASPTLMGQTLSFAFGPLEGPFAPVVFALGDPINAGTLYYTNGSNADAASDLNTLELCAPSEPLISGAVFNGIVIAGSRDNIFRVQYSYLASIGASSNTTYQFMRIPAPSGIWSRWACCRGPNGVYYLGRDGIYLSDGNQSVNISDVDLYSLFPHDGAPGVPVLFESALGIPFGYYPVDMTQLSQLRLTAADQDIYFDYVDSNGNQATLRYEINKKRWFPHTYHDAVTTHYLVEPSSSVPSTMTLLTLGKTTGTIFTAAGNTDNGYPLVSEFMTPAIDGGDERMQKLYVDVMHLVDGTVGNSFLTSIQYNNAATIMAQQTHVLSGQPVIPSIYLDDIASLADLPANLDLYRNVSVFYSWFGGPGGARFYAWEPSYYEQPYLSNFLATQFKAIGTGGWTSHRRLYPAYISTSDLIFTIQTQDGRTYTFTLPSTGGQLTQIPLMLDQTIKDLMFAYQLDGQGQTYALFPDEFVIETKGWTGDSFERVPVFMI